MNERNFTYVSQNSVEAMRMADDKLATKNLMLENDISTPDLYQVFENRNDLLQYDFSKLPDDFVLKPNAGLG
jgi:glutathione synthase/RimK-type ligase-like ATP-grasp enzyme